MHVTVSKKLRIGGLALVAAAIVGVALAATTGLGNSASNEETIETRGELKFRPNKYVQSTQRFRQEGGV
jgi:hypothetical protein